MDVTSPGIPWQGVLLYALFGYILPISLGIIVWPLSIPYLVKRFFVRKTKKPHPFPSLKPFWLSIVLLVALANLVWIFLIKDKVYYEWDSVFATPFFLLGYEGPVLDGTGSWLADGWQEWQLYALWLGMIVVMYAAAAGFALYRARRASAFALFRKVVLVSIALLLLVSVGLLPAIGGIFSKVTQGMGEPKERDAACTAVRASQIYYRGNAGQPYASDITGRHVRNLLNVSGLPFGNDFSPDGTKYALVLQGKVWIACTDGVGSYPIPLPPAKLRTHFTNQFVSKLSWSPDSRYLLLNFQGDVLMLDTTARTTRVLKEHVALRDNHVDITRKRSQSPTYLPYEVGDVLWGADQTTIYFTAFAGDTARVVAYDLTSNTELTVLEKQQNLQLGPLSPGRKLVVMQRKWSDQQHPEQGPPAARTFILDLATRKATPPLEERFAASRYLWSEDGKYLLNDALGGADGYPDEKQQPTILQATGSNASVKLDDFVTVLLNQRHLVPANTVVTIQPLAMKHNTILARVLFLDTPTPHFTPPNTPPSNLALPAQLNVLVHLDGEIEVLQSYAREPIPFGSASKPQERLFPVTFVGQ